MDTSAASHGPSEGVDEGAEGRPGLIVTAAHLGGHLWIEEALFGITGRWSADSASPTLAVHFATQSALHAWRADEWRRRMPRSVPSGPVPPRGWQEAVALADALDGDACRLGAWAGALGPSLLTRYFNHSAHLSGAADEGLERWIRIALDDTMRGWVAGRALLEEAIAGNSAVLAGALEAEAACRRLLSS